MTTPTAASELVTPDDPRLLPYRSLKQTNLTRWSERFIAEGGKVVERLLASTFEVESVLVSERRTDFLDRVPPGINVLRLPQPDCEALTGFDFHQGMMACGIRRPSPTIESLLGRDGRLTFAVAPRMTDPDNLGSLLRLCAAFGVDGLVLGPGSADPFSRRALRISMGAAFEVSIVEPTDLFAALDILRERVAIVGTVLDASALPLASATRSERTALLFGNEAHGLSAEEAAACDRCVTIPMAPAADSLNVAYAAAIVLYHYTRVL